MKEKLIAIIRTLDTIPVKGRGNIDKMLGVFMLLDELINEAEELDGRQTDK